MLHVVLVMGMMSYHSNRNRTNTVLKTLLMDGRSNSVGQTWEGKGDQTWETEALILMNTKRRRLVFKTYGNQHFASISHKAA